ncbi:hypothetical protein [Microbacterium sp.]|uniref:hypothetical protein n=1 Tax=Microbacterium sp. TaxID=51671 RepID=UPI003A92F3B2
MSLVAQPFDAEFADGGTRGARVRVRAFGACDFGVSEENLSIALRLESALLDLLA